MTTKKNTVKKKIYRVYWYCNGYNYRTTTECTWDDVQDLRRTAKLIGDTIKYKLDRVVTYNY